MLIFKVISFFVVFGSAITCGLFVYRKLISRPKKLWGMEPIEWAMYTTIACVCISVIIMMAVGNLLLDF